MNNLGDLRELSKPTRMPSIVNDLENLHTRTDVLADKIKTLDDRLTDNVARSRVDEAAPLKDREPKSEMAISARIDNITTIINILIGNVDSLTSRLEV